MSDLEWREWFTENFGRMLASQARTETQLSAHMSQSERRFSAIEHKLDELGGDVDEVTGQRNVERGAAQVTTQIEARRWPFYVAVVAATTGVIATAIVGLILSHVAWR